MYRWTAGCPVAVSARGRAHLATRFATRLGRVRDGVAQPRRRTHEAAAQPSRDRSQALLQQQCRALTFVMPLPFHHRGTDLSSDRPLALEPATGPTQLDGTVDRNANLAVFVPD